MHGLARVCVQRPVFATVLSLTLLVLGVAGYLGLGVDRFPKVEFPTVTVSTVYSGASPEEVETEVTDKIEQQVNTIGGIDTLQSSSAEGLSLVIVQFLLEKDADVAAEEVRSKVSVAVSQLPPDAEQPVVQRFDVGSVPVISYAVSADANLRDVYEYVDKVVRRRLETVPGVGEVQVLGGRERQINIIIDPYRLRAYGLTVTDVTDAIARQNTQVPGGLVEQGDRQLTLRTPGRMTKVEDFSNISIKSLDRTTIRVGDVARVEDGASRATSIASIDGNETVVLQIVKQSDANAVRVVDLIKERVAEIEPTLPSGYSIAKVRDQSIYIKSSLHAVQEHLIMGAILAAIVVFLFLGNLRATVIAALAIPTSIITTFAVMRYLGFTQNNITLLALTLSVGIVIDDAIVVLENVFRVIEEEGLDPHAAAIRATREIGLAVLAITMSLVAVFLPVAFMSGIVGRFLNSFGITMAAAIVVSMFVSFSLTPMLCSRWLDPPSEDGPKAHHEASSKTGWFAVIDRAYTALLTWALRHKLFVSLGAVVIIGSLLPLMGMARKNFLPEDDEAQFQIVLRAPEGTSLEGTRRIAESIAKDVEQLPEVKLTLVTVGDDNERSANSASIYCRMNEVEDRQDPTVTQFSNMATVRKEFLPKYAGRGLQLSVQQTSAFGGGSNARIQISVSGPNLAQLAKYSEAAVAQCKQIPGVADVDSTLRTGKPELQAIIDRQRAADLGVSVADVARTLRLSVGGDDKISSYTDNGEQYEVHVRLDEQYRRDADGIALLEVPSKVNGETTQIGLDQVVRFETSTSPATIRRYNRQRQFTLLVNNLPGSDQGAIQAQVHQVLEGLRMGPGYHIDETGQSREFRRMGKNFLLAFLLSGIFMFLVLSAQFESFLNAAVILTTLPLTIPFAVLSIILTRDSMNIFSMLGMLVLVGVVKKNAILQIDRANQLREHGMGLVEATIQASRDRLRPILMTTLAFVAGMIPLVLSSGTGAATNKTTGGVIVYGQVLSLLITLIAAPVFYVLVDGFVQSDFCRRVRSTVFGRRARKAEEGGREQAEAAGS